MRHAGDDGGALRPLGEVAAQLGLAAGEIVPYGREMAKLPLALLDGPRRRAGAGRLVLVSAITPTPAGEGKTTISIASARGSRASASRPASRCASPPWARSSA